METIKTILIIISGAVAVFAYFALIFLLNVLLWGLALSWAWEWFVVPVFDVGGITIVQSFGLMIVASTLTKNNAKSVEQEEGETVGSVFGRTVLKATVAPLVTLFFAWLVSLLL
jgi:hypothetical protein